MKTISSNIRKELAAFNIAITVNRDIEEYRVNFKSGKEATAYYTSDVDDAIETGRRMGKKEVESGTKHPMSLRHLNKWLHSNGVSKTVTLFRSRAGYYYFSGEKVSSGVYVFNCTSMSFAQWLREYNEKKQNDEIE